MLIIYTGKGKGKTSAAIGAVIRSLGWRRRVAIVQFVKSESWPSGERGILRQLGVDLFVMGASWVGIMGDRKDRGVHIDAAKKAVRKVIQLLRTAPKYDLIVCDEILGALQGRLISRTDIEGILDLCSKNHTIVQNLLYDHDVILTGQNAPMWLIKKADLVTKMEKIKHPYDKGVLAKKGIDF